MYMWNSWAKQDHWKKVTSSSKVHMAVGASNIINEPLVDREKTILPPFYIKLGLEVIDENKTMCFVASSAAQGYIYT